MRASRLLSILLILQLRGKQTADALAAEFEVSVRTIYRDIDQLSAAGVPVYAGRGPDGGFQLLDGYRTKLTGLSADEAQALFMIGLEGPARAMGLGPQARGVRNKLLAALTPQSGQDAMRIGARFHLDPADWYREEESLPHLPLVMKAVLDQTVMRMRYESWTGMRDWQIAPLGLVLKAGQWYLAARAGKLVRTFKVSNIHEPVLTASKFERASDFDLADYWTRSLAQFERRLRPNTATLAVTQAGLKRVAEQGAYAARAAAAATPHSKKDWLRLELPVETEDRAALMVLCLGADAEVLEPKSLRVRVRDLARAVTQRNKAT